MLPVNTSIFHKKSLSKGKKLLESFHVSDVKEVVDGQSRELIGIVLREPPGAHSTRRHENFLNYNII